MRKLQIIVGILVLIGFDGLSQICPVTTGIEKITNGNFSSGNSGFSSDYTFSTPSVGPGQYGVGTNPNSMNSFYASIGDHTTGSGNMLVVDVDATANKDAYNTTVNVIAGTDYFFSAWFANINTNTGWSGSNGRFENSPQLKFSINNVQVGSIVKVDSVTHLWRQFFVNWNSGAVSGPITIRIENVNTSSSNGNDLALDDISFSTGCDKISNLNTLGQNSALIDTVKNCTLSFPYTLNPGLPGSYGFSWRNSAGTLLTAPATGATYSVGSAPADGTKYYLCYEYIAGCPRKDSVIFKNTPLTVELGAPIVMCAPVNVVLNSGATSPPVTIQWYKNGVPVATTATYTATDIGTYSVDLSRAGCGSASDNIVVSNPVSTIAGSGNFCAASNTADFTATGSTQIKWYTVASGGSPLNPSNSNATISLAHLSTNTTTPGCSSGLYAEDISSYPGTVFPANPCGSNTNFNGNSDMLIEISQTLNLTSVDFFQNSGWGNGTFTFSILNNGPSAGPWCGPCGANKDGPTGVAVYSVTTPVLTAPGSGSLQRTIATSYTLNPGRYWFRLSASGTAMGLFNCNQTFAANSNLWQTPFVDNTGNNVARIIDALQGGNNQSSGALLNIKFQVGNANTCSRLFICAIDNCVAPVELIQFDAKKYSEGNVVTWKTASEQNSAYFIVQRSIDGIHFENIGQVTAAGNSTTLISYSYVDDTYSHEATVVYYRLQQMDVDATKHYSEIRSLNNDEWMQPARLYPIPVKRGQNVLLEYRSAQEENIIVEIFDNPGKVVRAGEYRVLEGTNTIELNTASLAAGLYHMTIKGATSRTTKFIVE